MIEQRGQSRITSKAPDVGTCGDEVWQIGADGLIARSRGQFDAEDYRRQLEAGN